LTHIHTHSIRLPNGAEALVTRVVAGDGRIGYGFSLGLDATESRQMAEANLDSRRPGVPALPPEIQAAIDKINWEDK
jgi:hypothetical protein